MKKIFLILLAPILLFATPSWFFHLKHDGGGEIIGYGMDEDLKKAKQGAILDITNSISVSVSSSIDISSSDIGGRAKQDSSMNLHTVSKAVLSGVEFIKIENEDGMWYVGAKYDNSPLDVKLKKLLPKNLKDEKQNAYLKHTWGIQKLNSKIGKKLNYELVRKNNLWQLEYKEFLIPMNQEDLYKLFADVKNKKISIKANKKIYKENDEMYFYIKHKKMGYISILYVEHNGKVGILLANKKSYKSFRYPDKKSEDIFRIANPYKKTIKELYVAIHSTRPINLYEFENVSENTLDESNYNFHKLITRLDKLNFCTFVIKISEH